MTMVMLKPNILKSYKANTSSIITAVIDEDTGEEKKRLINSTRWKGYGPEFDEWLTAYRLRNAPEVLAEWKLRKIDSN